MLRLGATLVGIDQLHQGEANLPALRSRVSVRDTSPRARQVQPAFVDRGAALTKIASLGKRAHQSAPIPDTVYRDAVLLLADNL